MMGFFLYITYNIYRLSWINHIINQIIVSCSPTYLLYVLLSALYCIYLAALMSKTNIPRHK